MQKLDFSLRTVTKAEYTFTNTPIFAIRIRAMTDKMLPSQGQAAHPQMYVIALERGNQDDQTTCILSVTDDLVAGQAWVDAQNAVFRSLRQKRQALTMATLRWREEHPMPDMATPVLVDAPKTPSDRPATLEEREEKHRINNENFLRTLSAREPQRLWARKETAFVQAWLQEHLTEQEAALDATSTEHHWSIQPAPWHNAAL